MKTTGFIKLDGTPIEEIRLRVLNESRARITLMVCDKKGIVDKWSHSELLGDFPIDKAFEIFEIGSFCSAQEKENLKYGLNDLKQYLIDQTQNPVTSDMPESHTIIKRLEGKLAKRVCYQLESDAYLRGYKSIYELQDYVVKKAEANAINTGR